MEDSDLREAVRRARTYATAEGLEKAMASLFDAETTMRALDIAVMEQSVPALPVLLVSIRAMEELVREVMRVHIDRTEKALDR